MCNKNDLLNIAKELSTEVLNVCPNLEKIILYGSYARGDNTAESDVDVMIIVDDTEEAVKACRKKISCISSALGLKYDVLLSVMLRDKANFEKRVQYMPFYQNIVNEGIEWYGRAA